MPAVGAAMKYSPPTTSTLISPDVRRQSRAALLSPWANNFVEEGYQGLFGLDFLLDQDSGELYLGEMNPRITGATPLTNLAAHDRHQPPLLLFHLLEWLGIDFSFDIDEYNRRAGSGPRRPRAGVS